MKTRNGIMRLKSTCRYFFSSSPAPRAVADRTYNPVSSISSINTYLSNTMLSDRKCTRPHIGRWDNTRNDRMARFYSSAIDGKNVGEDNVANVSERQIIRSTLDNSQNRTEINIETQNPCVERATKKDKAPVLTRVERYRDDFLKRIVQWEEITDSWDNFPYDINERTKSLLSECLIPRLKKDLKRDYSGRLASSGGRIMLQSIPGTVLYRNKLVGALARELQVSMLVLDSSFLPPYSLSKDGSNEDIESDSEDENEDEDESDLEYYSSMDDESSDDEDSDDEGDSKNSAGTCKKCGSRGPSESSSSSTTTTSSKSKPEKTNCLLMEGDRVKYIGPTTTSTNETKRILSTGQRGEVREVNGDKVGVIFSLSDLATKEIDTQLPSLSWLDVNHVKHDCDAKMHDCHIAMEALCEVIKSRQPLILYFPDSFRWLPSSASRKSRREFVKNTKKMFGQLTGRVVLICGRDKWERGWRKMKKYPLSLKKLFGELKATKRVRSDGANKLFTNVVDIKPPKDKDLMKKFFEQIEADRKTLISRSNSNEMHKILKDHGLLCTDLDHVKIDDVLLTKRKAEKVVGWATNHHLSSCISPPLEGEQFHVPHDSFKIAVSRLKEEEEESKEPSKKKSFENLSTNRFERDIVSSVIRPEEIGVKFDDVGALEHVKNVLNELVILPMKRPELFSRGNLLRPCKGLLLFGPPGTGKTLIAKALATEAGANFINVTCASLTSMWHGESEKYARALFTLACKIAPAVIFVDEVDSLLGDRGRGYEGDPTRRLKNEFMSSWDGMKSKDSQRILVIGATNRPFDLDDAVIRRMPRRIYVDLPDVENRFKILKILLGKENLDSGFSFEQLAEATDSYSGSDLKNLCVAAAYRPVQELLQEESKGNKVDGAPSLRPLNLDDFIRSKNMVGPSVSYSAESMIELREWNEQYGEGGSRNSRKSPFGF